MSYAKVLLDGYRKRATDLFAYMDSQSIEFYLCAPPCPADAALQADETGATGLFANTRSLVFGLEGGTPNSAWFLPGVWFAYMTTLLIIVVLVLFLGGGGFFWSRRGR